jgi:hypothetical protein
LETGWNNTAAGIFNASEIDIFNYSSSVTFKSVFGRNAFEQGTSGLNEMNIGTWASNSALTNIDVSTNTGWYPGSTATLYGIKAGA